MNFSDSDAYALAVLVRLAERALLTTTILIVAIVIMIAFWKRVQRVQLELNRDDNVLKADVVFIMPVFLLLALILFAFVSFSSPIEASSIGTEVKGTESDDHPQSRGSSFNGIFGTEPTTQVFYLNALSAGISALSSSANPEGRTQAAGLINLQRLLVADFYGQPVLDDCRDSSSSSYETQTCRNIRRWLATSP